MSFIDVLYKILPILLLLAVVGVVIWRLPKVEIKHTKEFESRRRMNWIFLGLTYAFLYFGRYNLAVVRDTLLSTKDRACDALLHGSACGILDNEMFGRIFAVGAVVYGLSVVINAPLCDRLGGRKTLMIGAIGASIANLLMGLFMFHHDAVTSATGLSVQTVLIPLFALNMYFQSFGAISIVKVNSAWFHVRERGIIGGIFGILISLGYYFAFDWNTIIVGNLPVSFAFIIPAGVLFLMFLVTVFIVRDSPEAAGLGAFNTGDATSGDTGPRMPVLQVFKKILTNPIILTIACIEFCSGYIRDGIMQWGTNAAKAIESHHGEFIFSNWGMVSCCAGIMAGITAGIISDRVFQSRRGPVAAILYGGLLGLCLTLFLVLGNGLLGYVFAAMVLCVIGVHGMLSGTASMDFGGSKNAGIATGIIDGFAYVGSATSTLILGTFLPNAKVDPEYAANPDNWTIWPKLLLPAIVIGLILSSRIWNATVKKSTPKAEPAPDKADKPADAIGASDAKADDASDAKADEAKASDEAKPVADPA